MLFLEGKSPSPLSGRNREELIVWRESRASQLPRCQIIFTIAYGNVIAATWSRWKLNKELT